MKKTVARLLCTYSRRKPKALFFVPRSLFSILCSLFSVHYSFFSVLYSFFSVLYSLFFILFSFYFSPAGAQTQSGQASFYSKRATGSRTANGEKLHHDSLTCAHRSYPFGTLLRVTNMVNGQQVVVRVNDRGPYRRGRIIDLSWGAAKAIGMLAQGIVPVSVERLRETNIPFKPDDDDDGPEVPRFEFELADIAPAGIVPVWQHEIKIDHQKVQRSMRRTASKSAQETYEPAMMSPVSPSRQEKQKATDAFNQINAKPNAAKAYLKREGKR